MSSERFGRLRAPSFQSVRDVGLRPGLLPGQTQPGQNLGQKKLMLKLHRRVPAEVEEVCACEMFSANRPLVNKQRHAPRPRHRFVC